MAEEKNEEEKAIESEIFSEHLEKPANEEKEYLGESETLSDEDADAVSDEAEALKKVEAALFLAARFLSLNELVKFTGINPIMLRELLLKLEKRYGDSAIAILKKEIDNTELWKMDVEQEHAHLINKLATGKTEFTRAEQETLAIISYKQPIKQSVVIKIRGNKAYEHVKHFIAADLIKARKLGRTLELNVSDKFYDYFALKENKEEK